MICVADFLSKPPSCALVTWRDTLLDDADRPIFAAMEPIPAASPALFVPGNSTIEISALLFRGDPDEKSSKPWGWKSLNDALPPVIVFATTPPMLNAAATALFSTAFTDFSAVFSAA